MEIKIKVKMPKGHARDIEKKVRPFLLIRRINCKTIFDDEDSMAIYHIDDSPEKVMKMIKRVSMFDTIISSVMNNKKFQKHAKKHLDKDGQAELADMLTNHTSVELIRQSEFDDIDPILLGLLNYEGLKV